MSGAVSTLGWLVLLLFNEHFQQSFFFFLWLHESWLGGGNIALMHACSTGANRALLPSIMSLFRLLFCVLSGWVTFPLSFLSGARNHPSASPLPSFLVHDFLHVCCLASVVFHPYFLSSWNIELFFLPQNFYVLLLADRRVSGFYLAVKFACLAEQHGSTTTVL